MDVSLFNAREEEPPSRVSIPLRLIAALSCLFPVVGVAVGSTLLTQMFVALSQNESAGTADVVEILTSASYLVAGSVYLAIICGLVVIVLLVRRISMQANTASPPVWFFAATGILYLLPIGTYLKAHLLLLEAISPNTSIPTSEMESTGAYVAELLILSLGAAVIVSIPMVVMAVVPFSSRSTNDRMSLIGATAIEILLIGTALLLPV